MGRGCKNMKRVIARLLVIMMILTGSGTALATQGTDTKIPKADVFTVKEGVSGIGALMGNAIKYAKSEVEGHDLTVYTIVRGKYSPINILEFLKHEELYSYTVISQEKATYIQEDTEGVHRLYINESGSSMEPIVLSLGEGKNVAIRWSREFTKQ